MKSLLKTHALMALLALGGATACGGLAAVDETEALPSSAVVDAGDTLRSRGDAGQIRDAAVCPDPNDPAVHYIGSSDQDPEICTRIFFACDSDQTPFTDECGCGCIDNAPVCPDPSDPTVHYISQDPLQCAVVRFACDADQTPFTDECGCGCIDNAPACPDPSDPAVHYIAGSDQNPDICQVILFGCDEDQTLFTDACGCGCIDGE